MIGDHLPDQHHISRYCKPVTIADGKPTGASFMLRPVDDFLSVNWLEYFGNIDQDSQIDKVRECIELSLAASGLFAILNVGEIIAKVLNECEKQISVKQEPTAVDPSHCGIYGYQHEDDMVADLISDLVLKTYPSKIT